MRLPGCRWRSRCRPRARPTSAKRQSAEASRLTGHVPQRLPPNSGEGIVAFQTNISGRLPDVRFGSLADIGGSNCDVRFTPESGHQSRALDVLYLLIADIGNSYSITSSVRAITAGGF